MQSFIDWILAHQGLMAGLLVAVIDFIFALAPGLQANGILHAIYGFLKPKAQLPSA